MCIRDSCSAGAASRRRPGTPRGRAWPCPAGSGGRNGTLHARSVSAEAPRRVTGPNRIRRKARREAAALPRFPSRRGGAPVAPTAAVNARSTPSARHERAMRGTARAAVSTETSRARLAVRETPGFVAFVAAAVFPTADRVRHHPSARVFPKFFNSRRVSRKRKVSGWHGVTRRRVA